MATEKGIDAEKLKRRKPDGDGKKPVKEMALAVTAGPIEKVLELAFNPSRDKIREVTVIDRIQGRLLPQLDLLSSLWAYAKKIALYRQDAKLYFETYDEERPIPPDLISEFTYRTAQWQKSVMGKNLERAIDIALAEVETKAEEQEPLSADEAWKD